MGARTDKVIQPSCRRSVTAANMPRWKTGGGWAMISAGLRGLVFNSSEFPIVANLIPAADVPNSQESRTLRLAMGLSLAVGFLMLGMKTFAYALTGSAAILSDAAESVVHVVAVSFAVYSLWLSRKPPDP